MISNKIAHNITKYSPHNYSEIDSEKAEKAIEVPKNTYASRTKKANYWWLISKYNNEILKDNKSVGQCSKQSSKLRTKQLMTHVESIAPIVKLSFKTSIVAKVKFMSL